MNSKRNDLFPPMTSDRQIVWYVASLIYCCGVFCLFSKRRAFDDTDWFIVGIFCFCCGAGIFLARLYVQTMPMKFNSLFEIPKWMKRK